MTEYVTRGKLLILNPGGRKQIEDIFPKQKEIWNNMFHGYGTQ